MKKHPSLWNTSKLKMQSLALREPVHTKTALALGGDWAQILAAASLAHWSGSWLVYALAVVCIASRQHGLLVLMHEAAHGHLSKDKKWNDRLSNWAAAWPLGVETHRYREHHWKHHEYTNSDYDPDWARKRANPRWHFPQPKKKFFKSFLPYFAAVGAVEMSAVAWMFGRPVAWIPRLVHLALCLAPFAATGTLSIVFLYWLVPWATALPLLMKVRSVVEHLGLPDEHELNGTRNILASPLEAYFFGPHGNALHLIHHLYPHVPWHKLAAMRQILRDNPVFAKDAHENTSYFLPSPRPVIRDLSEQPNRRENEQQAA